MTQLDLNHNKPLMMHIDLNSCFATVMQQANPFLRGKPLVIAAYPTPRGCIVAPSIEAKQFGIKTGMRVMEAKLICKNVIVMTYDESLVRDVHIRLKRICNDYSTSVRPKSIDEVVIDFEPMQAYLKRDLIEVAAEMKQRVRKEIGEWIRCSIGIGTNCFWAKTGAGLRKPDGLVVINHQNIVDVYSKMKLTDLSGINIKFEARLNASGIFTPLQFLAADLDVLRKQVFQSIGGFYWYKRLRGYEMDGFDFARKSFGQDYALAEKTSDPEKLARIVMKLCEKMGRRLRRGRYSAKGVHIACIYDDYTYWHTGKTFHMPMITTLELYRKALLLLNSQPQKKIVAKLGVSCFGLEDSNNIQETLFENEDTKMRKVSEAIDKINDKYGEFVITPARMMGMENVVIDRIAFGGVKELEDIYDF